MALLVVPVAAGADNITKNGGAKLGGTSNKIGAATLYSPNDVVTTTMVAAATTTTAAPTTTTAAPTTTTTPATTTTKAPTTTTTAAPTTTTTVNQPPTVSNINTSCSGATCTLSVTASDPGGGTVAYRWTVNGTQISTTSSYTGTAPATGTYNIQVVVTEAGGLSTTKSTTVTCTKPKSTIQCS